MADAELPPIPGVVVGGLLRLIAAGLEPVELGPLHAGGTAGVNTATGWWLLLALDEQGKPVQVLHAQPPTMWRLPWTWGCQRDDWTLGPDSRVLTPLELLTVEQREQLAEVLKRSVIRWEWLPLPYWDLSNLQEMILD